MLNSGSTSDNDQFETFRRVGAKPASQITKKNITSSFINSLLSGCKAQDLAMDLGTANTLIYMKGRGIVLDEPSVVALKENGKPFLVGREAKDIYGKTGANIRCIRPIKDGVIADFEATHQMIQHFITKVTNKWQLRRPRLVVSIPSGVTMVEKRAVIDACASAGIRHIHLIEEPMAACIGAGLPVLECGGNMVVDIGGGTTEIAVISMGGTVYSESIRVAGDEMDDVIEQFIRRTFNLQIGIFEAERIKKTIGSALPMKEARETTIYGRDIATGVPRELVIDDSIVRRALKDPLEAIVEAVYRALERTNPEIAQDVIQRGVYLAGGGSLLKGLPERLSLEMNIPFRRAHDPLTAIVRGSGHVIDNFDQYKLVLIS